MSTFIVSYLMDGQFRATRHAEGCGVLSNARKQEGRYHPYNARFTALQVLSEESHARSGRPVPVDHSCVPKQAPLHRCERCGGRMFEEPGSVMLGDVASLACINCGRSVPLENPWLNG